MVIIDNVLISDDLFESHFMCDLQKCKGACCWEGDFGAPLNEEEQEKMDDVFLQCADLLSAESREWINRKGPFALYDDPPFTGTTLMPDGACAFLVRGTDGIARCGIEQAHAEGRSAFRKPVSCHLYPLRIEENPKTGFIALNYDRWSICSPACSLGEALRMPLFRFVREGIIRRFGPDFYARMEGYYQKYYLSDGE